MFSWVYNNDAYIDQGPKLHAALLLHYEPSRPLKVVRLRVALLPSEEPYNKRRDTLNCPFSMSELYLWSFQFPQELLQ